MSRLWKPLVASAVLFLSAGCNEKLAKAGAVGDPGVSGQGIPDFSSLLERVLRPRCVSCHQHYATYAGASREARAILSAVESDRMPKGGPPLAAWQKEALRRWVEAGAPQFADRPPEEDPADRLEPVWASVSRNILAPKCLLCHSPSGQANFLDLSSPETLKGPAARLVDLDDPEASELIAIVRDPEEPMPPRSSNIPPLSEVEIQVLIEWIRRGLP